MLGTNIYEHFRCPKCNRKAIITRIIVTGDYMLYIEGKCGRCLSPLWTTWSFEALTQIATLINGEPQKLLEMPNQNEITEEDQKFLKIFHISVQKGVKE